MIGYSYVGIEGTDYTRECHTTWPWTLPIAVTVPVGCFSVLHWRRSRRLPHVG
jgi:hypothetical protein